MSKQELLPRPRLREAIEKARKRSPVAVLIGPRQCGKSTLAHQLAGKSRTAYFDLEDPRSLTRLDHPLQALESLRGLVVIDEVQRRPDLLPILRVLADRRPSPARFLLLGSASPDLIRGSSETLAGRVAFVRMSGFDLDEVGAASWRRLWWRGGFPRAYLAADEDDCRAWQEDFIQTFLERDLRQLGILVAPPALRRFWSMVAHYHGQVWNASEIGRSLQVAHTTVKHYLDILSGALVLRQLPPWFENVGKRQVKSPKVYVRDSGLLHTLLRIPSMPELEGHPKLGASWEGFALEQILRVAGERDAYFWSTQSGPELDLLLTVRGRRVGLEIK
jgi:predicted AAA+ superfamily ATPase